jgi:hypothetical protein
MGVSTHMWPSDGILLFRLPHSDSFITVGNGSNIPISYHGTSTLSTANTTFHLNNVLVARALVRNLFLSANSLVTIHAPSNLMLWVFLSRTCTWMRDSSLQ